MMKTSLTVFILFFAVAFMGIAEAQNATSAMRYFAREMFDPLQAIVPTMDQGTKEAMTYVIPLSQDVIADGLKQLCLYLNTLISTDIKGYVNMGTSAVKMAGGIIPKVDIGGHTNVQELVMNLVYFVECIFSATKPAL